MCQKGKAAIIYPDLEYYEGQIDSNGMKHGTGIYYYKNGQIYDGQFVEDNRVGKGKLQYPDGCSYIGQFIENNANGHGIFTDAKNNRYRSIIDEDEANGETGQFVKGQLYGKGEIRFINGNIYVGLFKATKRDGQGKMVYNIPDESEYYTGTYIGEWKRNKRQGQGTMKYDSGNSFTGKWMQDKLEYGEFTEADGTKYIGQFNDNQYNGIGQLHLLNGVIVEGEFKNGEFTNKGKLIFENKSIFEGNIEEFEIGNRGVLTRPILSKTGKLAGVIEKYEGQFKDQVPHGFGILTKGRYKYEGKWEEGFK
jgi:hypothetical protein